VLAVLAVFYTLFFARAVFLPVILAILLSFLLLPARRTLTRWGVPERWAAAVLLAIVTALLALGVAKLSDPATRWIQQAPSAFEEVRDKLRRLLGPARELSKTAAQVQALADPGKEPNTPVVETKKPSLFGATFSYTANLLLSGIEMLVLLYFLLASPGFFTRVLKLTLNPKGKHEAADIARELEQQVSRYLLTIALIYAADGTLVALVMYLVGIPNPILWGVLSASAHLVPYLGPVTLALVLGVVSFLTFDSTPRALLPPLLYCVIDFLEGNFITPLIIGQRFTLSPVMVFLSLIFWVWMWGVAGALLAVPILVTFKIFCDHIDSLNPLGKFLSR
jgi:predicted PurR-regulated permease PerM